MRTGRCEIGDGIRFADKMCLQYTALTLRPFMQQAMIIVVSLSDMFQFSWENSK